jgi:hypothetical protein
MRMRAVLIAMVAGRAAAAAQEAAPDTSEIAPGDAVRVTAPALGLDKWKGWYLSAGFDSVTVRAADSSVQTLPLEKIARLEVNHRNIPSKGNAGAGAVLGGLGGMLLGAMAADPANIDTCVTSDSPDCSYAQLRGGMYGLLIGAALGAGIGALIRTEHWTDVPINPPEVTVAFPPGSYGALGLAFRF